jgi:hypothetical protein
MNLISCFTDTTTFVVKKNTMHGSLEDHEDEGDDALAAMINQLGVDHHPSLFVGSARRKERMRLIITPKSNQRDHEAQLTLGN